MEFEVGLSDLSGTLIDDLERIYRKVVYELSGQEILREEFKEKFTLNFPKFYEEYGINFEDALKKYFPIYDMCPIESRIIPGANNFLTELKKDYRLGLVTGARKIHLEKELEFVGLNKEHFEVLICGVLKDAENTIGVETAIKEMGTKPEKVFYLCDHPDDILMCNQIGIFPIVFDWQYGYSTKERIEKSLNGKGKIVSSYDEALDFLRA